MVLDKPLMPKKGPSHNRRRGAFSKVKIELYKITPPAVGKREMASVKKKKVIYPKGHNWLLPLPFF